MPEPKDPQPTSGPSSLPLLAPASSTTRAASPPLRRFNFGRIHATVWQRQYRQGQKIVHTHDISICRKYKDGGGNWCESHTFSPQDLLCVRMVISSVIRFLKLEHYVNAPLPPEAGAAFPAAPAIDRTAPTNPPP
jgi:hypothetical protein